MAPGGGEKIETASGPTVAGPLSGKASLIGTAFDLAALGYVEEEFFVSGKATAYTNTGGLNPDGRWLVTAAGAAEYATRLLLRRPADPDRFNGTVVAEWLNVSGGLESAPHWMVAHTHLMRDGFAWVGVSAQSLGVEGGHDILGGPAIASLKMSDPKRYAPLGHPGDSFSYDIFSQAGEAIRNRMGGRLFRGLEVRCVLAAGQSQSAFRLVTYVNAVDPVARVFDGFLVHSRGASGAPLSEPPNPEIPVPSVAQIRGDARVPVLTIVSETDLMVRGFHFLSARQPDGESFRLWEVAGSAHADTYLLVAASTDTGSLPPDRLAAALRPTSSPVGLPCEELVNSGPQVHYAVNAALFHLNRWVREGTPPPIAPRLRVEAGEPPRFEVDEHGNVLGGIRSPFVDVPISTLSGLGQGGPRFARLFGTTVPFDAGKLASLYQSKAHYLEAFDEATAAAVRAGFVLEADAREVRALGAELYPAS